MAKNGYFLENLTMLVPTLATALDITAWDCCQLLSFTHVAKYGSISARQPARYRKVAWLWLTVCYFLNYKIDILKIICTHLKTNMICHFLMCVFLGSVIRVQNQPRGYRTDA